MSAPRVVQLGTTVRDRHTGFTGLVTKRMEQLYGAVRICIEGPLDKDGKVQPEQWFDEARVEAVDGEKPPTGFRP